jgi:hypothetical protein
LIAVYRSGGTEDKSLGGATVVQQLAGVLGVRFDALCPLASANVNRGVEDVGEIVRNRGEVALAHVERYRCDAGIRESVPV